jgi:hypothetical protein
MEVMIELPRAIIITSNEARKGFFIAYPSLPDVPWKAQTDRLPALGGDASDALFLCGSGIALGGASKEELERYRNR